MALGVALLVITAIAAVFTSDVSLTGKALDDAGSSNKYNDFNRQMSEEVIAVDDWKSIEERGTCYPKRSCIREGGYCVKSRKDCNGIIGQGRCDGRRCKCCIPVIPSTCLPCAPPIECPTTSPPSTCPPVLCPTTSPPPPCPTCETPVVCPTSSPPPPCPTCETPVVCPTSSPPPPCPTCETPVVCPTTSLPPPCPIYTTGRKDICMTLGGVRVGSQCLTFNTDRLSWDDAAAACANNNGQLASLSFNADVILAYISTNYDTAFWVGGSDRASEGNWVWMDGTPFDDQTPWGGREPNDAGGNEDCLHVHSSLNDLHCVYESAYICELDNCVTLGGVRVGSQCLTFNTDRLSWDDAATACANNNGQLASLAFNADVILAYISTNYDVSFWVGGSDRASEGNWVWMDGTPFDDQTPWSGNEPNNCCGGEDCLHVHSSLNDLRCFHESAYICELDNSRMLRTNGHVRAIMNHLNNSIFQMNDTMDHLEEFVVHVKDIMDDKDQEQNGKTHLEDTMGYMKYTKFQVKDDKDQEQNGKTHLEDTMGHMKYTKFQLKDDKDQEQNGKTHLEDTMGYMKYTKFQVKDDKDQVKDVRQHMVDIMDDVKDTKLQVKDKDTMG